MDPPRQVLKERGNKEDGDKGDKEEGEKKINKSADHNNVCFVNHTCTVIIMQTKVLLITTKISGSPTDA